MDFDPKFLNKDKDIYINNLYSDRDDNIKYIESYLIQNPEDIKLLVINNRYIINPTTFYDNLKNKERFLNFVNKHDVEFTLDTNIMNSSLEYIFNNIKFYTLFQKYNSCLFKQILNAILHKLPDKELTYCIKIIEDIHYMKNKKSDEVFLDSLNFEGSAKNNELLKMILKTTYYNNISKNLINTFDVSSAKSMEDAKNLLQKLKDVQTDQKILKYSFGSQKYKKHKRKK